MFQSYQKALFWRRLMLAAFFTLFGATLLWVIPWFPYGLSKEDYNSNISLLISLMLLATTAAFAAIYLRETSRRIEQSLVVWSSMSDGLSDWSRREYFLERIVLECSRARADHGFFAVISLRLSVQFGSDNENVLKSMRVLERLVPDYDCLSSLGPHEIGVLARDLEDREIKEIARRLVQAVVEGFSDDESGEVDVQAGWAVYGKDASEAGALVGIARERLMRERQTNTTGLAGSEEADDSAYAA